MHTFNHSTWEAEADEFLWGRGQSDVHSQFLECQNCYIGKPHLNKKKKQQIASLSSFSVLLISTWLNDPWFFFFFFCNFKLGFGFWRWGLSVALEPVLELAFVVQAWLWTHRDLECWNERRAPLGISSFSIDCSSFVKALPLTDRLLRFLHWHFNVGERWHNTLTP